MFFFIQNKLDWHTYRLLRCRTVSEKLPKINLFGLSLIHKLRLLGSQQHPQSGVFLTAFSTWGTENSLAEINLESTGVGVIKGLTFLGVKIGKLVKLDEPAECVSGGDPLLLYTIPHLLFFFLVRILCALRLEGRKKLTLS